MQAQDAPEAPAPEAKTGPDVGHAASLVKDPVYHQLFHLLLARATSPEFKPGTRFLTERQISREYQVSRVTANKALSQLVMSGTLEFRKGVGTFLRPKPLANDLRSLVSFTRNAALQGLRPSTKVLAFRKHHSWDVPGDVADALRLQQKDEVFYFERLRLADEIPVILELRYVLASSCPHLGPADLEGSLYELLSQHPTGTVTRSDQTIRAVNLPPHEAKLLNVESGTAALWIHGVGMAPQPIWLENTYYRSDLYEFRNTIITDASAHA